MIKKVLTVLTILVLIPLASLPSFSSSSLDNESKASSPASCSRFNLENFSNEILTDIILYLPMNSGRALASTNHHFYDLFQKDRYILTAYLSRLQGIASYPQVKQKEQEAGLDENEKYYQYFLETVQNLLQPSFHIYDSFKRTKPCRRVMLSGDGKFLVFDRFTDDLQTNAICLETKKDGKSYSLNGLLNGNIKVERISDNGQVIIGYEKLANHSYEGRIWKYNQQADTYDVLFFNSAAQGNGIEFIPIGVQDEETFIARDKNGGVLHADYYYVITRNNCLEAEPLNIQSILASSANGMTLLHTLKDDPTKELYILRNGVSVKATFSLFNQSEEMRADAISEDGQMLIGTSKLFGHARFDPTVRPGQATLWHGTGVTTPLGILNNYLSTSAYASSEDGKVIIGYCFGRREHTGFIWTEQTGMHALIEWLQADAEKIYFKNACSISRNGMMITGIADVDDEELDDLIKCPYVAYIPRIDFFKEHGIKLNLPNLKKEPALQPSNG